MVMFRIKPLRSMCQYSMNVYSEGGIIVKESPCVLPRGHEGPHRSAYGGIVYNPQGFLEQLEKRGDK